MIEQMNQQILNNPLAMDVLKSALHGLLAGLEAVAAFLLLFAPIVAACLVDKLISQYGTRRQR
jgi:hypothetical protein